MTLRRGFLAEAERHAARIRQELGLPPSSHLAIRAIAGHLGVKVIAADELIDEARLHDLERIQAFAFSACTFDIDGTKVIVYNPLRSSERTESDVGHELSHLLLDHKLSEIRLIADVPFRTCSPDQEEEATNLGGTLLLPRPMLLRAARQGLNADSVAELYGVTVDMARFRLNRTGVTRQLQSRSITARSAT